MKQHSILWILVMAPVLAAVMACHSSSNAASTGQSKTTIAVSAAAQQEADTIFATRCAACHGTDGRGDGLAAAALHPKPRDYHDKQWQAKVTDAHIAKTIVEGGAAVGLSPLMAANPDLKNKPQVVQSLVNRIREFGQEY